MTKPRVIFVNRVYWPSPAATAQLLTDLAEGLAGKGWEVHVIAAGREPTRHRNVLIHRTGGSEQHGGLISRALNYARFRRGARQQLVRLVRPDDVVVLMTDPPLLGAAATRPATARGARVIHWIQDIYPEILSAHWGILTGWPLEFLRIRRDAAWRAARRCVTLGEAMAQTVATRHVPASRITILPNWAPQDLQAPAPREAISARRAAWGVADQLVVAYSGNLGRVHEFHAVLTAAECLRPHRDIVFLFIGAGARFDEIRATVQRRKLDNVRLLPPEPRLQLAAALAAADLQLVTLKPAFAPLVYPSKLAGVLAVGRPVLLVGPPDGEIARLLNREQCGATCGPAEGSRLAEIILQWQADPVRRAELGRNARTAYERQFTFTAALARWEAILPPTGPEA